MILQLVLIATFMTRDVKNVQKLTFLEMALEKKTFATFVPPTFKAKKNKTLMEVFASFNLGGSIRQVNKTAFRNQRAKTVHASIAKRDIILLKRTIVKNAKVTSD